MGQNEKKTIEEYMELAEKIAKDYFRQGVNCSEAVFKSLLDLNLTDFPPEVVAVATGFGGGIGLTKNTCGAVSGAVIGVSSIKGRKNPLEKEVVADRVKELTDKEKGIYRIFANLVKEFEDEYGTVICRELSSPYKDFHGRERRKTCLQIVGYTAALAAKYAVSEENK